MVKLSCVATLAALAVGVGTASSAPLTHDFNSLATGYYASNIEVQGTRFSPNCHIDITDYQGAGSFQNSRWLGWDASSCFPGSSGKNANYLGPEAQYSAVWIDRLGEYFSLSSMFVNSPGLEVRSSKGGVYLATMSAQQGPRVFDFTGDAWTDVSWLLLTHMGSIGDPHGIDQLVLQVPEPASLALVGLGLAAGCFAGRRKRRIEGHLA